MPHKLFKAIFLSLFLLTATESHVVSSENDSLMKLLASNIPDSSKVKYLNALSKNYFNDNPDTAVTIAASAKKLAEKINYKPGLALSLKNMGIACYLQGKYVDAIKIWQEAITVYEACGDKVGVANILSNQGAIYFAQGDDAKSLELHLKSLKIVEDAGDSLRILTSLNNIGALYLNKPATYKKALEYFLRSYKLAKEVKDQYLFGTATANLGEIYYKMGDDSTALVYLNQSLKAYEGTEDAPYTLNYIGRVYVRQKDFDTALKNHREAYEISKKLDTRLDMTQSLVGLAQAYYAKGDIPASIAAYKQSLEVGVPLNAVTEIKDAYEGLSKSYAQKSDFVNAFKYQNLLLAIKDTIYNINTDKKLGTLQFTFDLEKKESQISLLTKDKKIQEQEIRRQKLVRNGFVGGFAIVLLFAGIFFRQRNRISKEKKRSDELLLNILPAEVAEELKATGAAEAKSINEVTVLFTDFKGFTQLSEKLSAQELVAEINECFSAFDHIMQKFNVEKIKTIGDAYMAAGGLPVANQTNPHDVLNAAFAIQEFMNQLKTKKQAEGKLFFEIRIGVHTGPVVAGIVGVKKYSYDIWGDTVNTASRMESSGEVGKVNISGSTYEHVKNDFDCEYRGKVSAKGKGEIDMYFVNGRTA